VSEGGAGGILGGLDSSTGILHLQKSGCSETASSEGKGGFSYKEQPSVRDEISGRLHGLTIEFGLFFISLNIILGLFWGYCFYYERLLLSAAIAGAELLLIAIGLCGCCNCCGISPAGCERQSGTKRSSNEY